MKTIVISAKTVSGTVGLIICYSVSIYLFWNSQITLADFRIDPEHSHFTRFLHEIFGYGGRQGYPNKTVGVIAAFLSIHFSWALRYKAGYFIEALLKPYVKTSSGMKYAATGSEGSIIDATPAYRRLDTYIEEKSEENKNNIVSLANSKHRI